MKKTLGGDRLGSGKKMEVELHGYDRSTHDLGYIFRSTMSAGTLVPFMSEVALPGDTFDIDLDCNVMTHPTIGPLFGSFKVQLDVFQAPIRLYNPYLHNNKLDIGRNMSKIKLPQISLTARAMSDAIATTDPDNAQINPSCILSYLGIRGLGYIPPAVGGSVERTFNAIPWLAYWEIHKNYYANKQEENAYVIHAYADPTAQTVDSITLGSGILSIAPGSTPRSFGFNNAQMQIAFTAPPTLAMLENIKINRDPAGTSFYIVSEIAKAVSIVGNNAKITYDGMGDIVSSWGYVTQDQPRTTMPKLHAFPLANIDKMREEILGSQSLAAPFIVNLENIEPYNLMNVTNNIRPTLGSQEGLAVKTYQSDVFNNWLSTEWIDGTDGITQITAIDTSDGSFTLDTLNLSQKVYNMLNRIAVSGGSYDDWIDAVYTHDRYRKAESPIYHGGLIKELVFQEVVSNSGTSGEGGGEQPLGTLAGKGVMAKKNKGGKVVINVDEPSYIIGIISLTPRVDYSQGNRWDTQLKTMDDLHKPALDEIGFQELITEQMAYWDTVWNAATQTWVKRSAGKQPAWVNYMTNYNRTYGNFAILDNEMFMTLNRRYEFSTDNDGIKDLTTYVDPAKYNFIFAETALDAQNFWTQIAVDITARRKMSAKVMPNL